MHFKPVEPLFLTIRFILKKYSWYITFKKYCCAIIFCCYRIYVGLPGASHSQMDSLSNTSIILGYINPYIYWRFISHPIHPLVSYDNTQEILKKRKKILTFTVHLLLLTLTCFVKKIKKISLPSFHHQMMKKNINDCLQILLKYDIT